VFIQLVEEAYINLNAKCVKKCFLKQMEQFFIVLKFQFHIGFWQLFIGLTLREVFLWQIFQENSANCFRISYEVAGIRYNHQTANHSKREYARGIVHSSTIEQIWGDIKGIIRIIIMESAKKYRKLFLNQYIFAYSLKNQLTSYSKLSFIFFPQPIV